MKWVIDSHETQGKVASVYQREKVAQLTLLVAAMSSIVKTQAFASPTLKLLSTSGLLMSPVVG